MTSEADDICGSATLSILCSLVGGSLKSHLIRLPRQLGLVRSCQEEASSWSRGREPSQVALVLLIPLFLQSHGSCV